MKRPNKPAVYIRCSSKSQDTDAQRAAVQRYLDGRELDVPKDRWYEDAAVSGKNMDRPALKRLGEAIFHGEIDCVIFYSVDRFARCMVDGLNELDRWQKAGVLMVFVSQGFEIDPEEWSGQIIMKILIAITLAFAEQERERIRERRKTGIDHARQVTAKVREIQRRCPSATPKQIAEKLGLKIKQVEYLFSHPSATIYWGGRKSGNKVRKDISTTSVLSMMKRGFTIAEIVRYFGVARRTVYSRIQEMGGVDAVRQKLALESELESSALPASAVALFGGNEDGPSLDSQT